VGVHYPRKLVNHLRDVYGYRVEKVDSGIYYVLKDNDILPTQLIVTSELDYEANMWIAGLTNDMNDSEKADKLLKEYRAHKDNTLYESVMNVVVRANNELFNGGDVMCEALDELYNDEINKRAKDLANDLVNDIVANKDEELAVKDEELAVLRAQVAELQKRIAQQ
jgi:hypothetical protein